MPPDVAQQVVALLSNLTILALAGSVLSLDCFREILDEFWRFRPAVVARALDLATANANSTKD